MTRRSIRENIFLIVFKAEFNNQEEMEEQIRYSISRIEEPEEDPEDVAITEMGKVKEDDLAYIADKAHKILSMLPALDAKISEISDGWQIGRLGKPELAILIRRTLIPSEPWSVRTGAPVFTSVTLPKIVSEGAS